MRINISIKKVMAMLMIMLSCSDVAASSIISSVRYTGRKLAPILARQGFKSTPVLIRPVAQLNKLEACKPSFNQQLVGSMSHALTVQKVASSTQELNSDRARWLVLGGAMIAGDIAYEDYKNKYNFSDIDSRDRPKLAERVAYLKYKLKDVNLEPNFDFELVSRRLNYLSYDDIEEFLNQSLFKKNSLNFISADDVDEAYLEMHYGNKGELYSHEKALFTAYHEAGHSLIHALYLDEFRYAFIDYTSEYSFGYSGATSTEVEGDQVGRIIKDSEFDEMMLVAMFAGGISSKFSGLQPKHYEQDLDIFLTMKEVASDVQMIKSMASSMALKWFCLKEKLCSDDNIYTIMDLDENLREQVNKKEGEIIQEAFAKTIRLINLHQAELTKIADLLYEKGIITGREVYDIIGRSAPLLCFQYDRMVNAVEKYYEYK